MIQLGSLVKDKINGFSGVAMSSTVWLYGCIRVYVEPQELFEGKPVSGHTFDEQRLEVVKAPSSLLASLPVEPSKIALGSTVKDAITGFKGVVVATTTMLGGRATVGVESQSLAKDGKPTEGSWFEEARVELIKGPNPKLLPPAVVKAAVEKPPGGPQPDPAPRYRGSFRR